MKKTTILLLSVLTSVHAFALCTNGIRWLKLPGQITLPVAPGTKQTQALAKIKEYLIIQIQNGQFISKSDLSNGQLISQFEHKVDLSSGISYLFIGCRKNEVPAEKFLPRLQQHAALVKKLLVPHGLRGYFIYPSENYELAVMHWPSDEAMKDGFSRFGKVIGKDADQFLIRGKDAIAWQPLMMSPR